MSGRAEQQPSRVIDDSRLLTATALAIEDEAVDATLDVMLVVREGVETEANEVFAVSFS